MAQCHAFFRQSGIPPLATNRVYMIQKDQFPLHRILRAVFLNTKLSRIGSEDACHDHSFLNTPRDMIDQYPHVPAAIDNTLRVADAALVKWESDRVVFPSFENLNPEEANTLRKMVSKKHRKKRLRDFHDRFVLGASDREVERKVIDAVWTMMMEFYGYSFFKPHSASYTLLAYKSAWLRAYYPAEFMAAVISNQGGYYSTLSYISEARRMGIRMLPPDINRSEITYTGKDRTIRVGLMQLKGLSGEAGEAIVHERTKQGFFDSFDRFLYRISPRVRLQDVKILIKGGCFDSISRNVSRPGLMWKALRFFDRDSRERSASLFASVQGPVPASHPDPDYGGGYSRRRMLKHELESFGFVLSVHSLALYEDAIHGIDYVQARDLPSRIGKAVTVIGWPIAEKIVRTRDGEIMKFMTIEDFAAPYEAVLFPKTYHRYCRLLGPMRPYILKGVVEEVFTALTIRVDTMEVPKGVRAKPMPFIHPDDPLENPLGG